MIESPCSRTFAFASSGSSTATTGAGVDFTSSGAFDVMNFRKPRGKVLWSQRLFLSRAAWTGNFADSRGVTSIIGSNFSRLNFLADFSFANMMIIGHGSTSIRRPT